ncbi:hypothetical protein ACYOEI_24890 [Singulisphaera rosea]
MGFPQADLKRITLGLQTPDGSCGMTFYKPEAQASEFPQEKSKKIHSLALRACIEEMPLEG